MVGPLLKGNSTLATIFGRDESSLVVGGLRYAVGVAFDAKFFHSVSQRIRVHPESLGSSVRALNNAVSFAQHCEDVPPFNLT